MARSLRACPDPKLWTGAFPFLRPNYDTLVCDFGQAGDDPALSKEELSPALAGLSLAPAAGHSSRLLEPIALIGIAWLRRNEERSSSSAPLTRAGLFFLRSEPICRRWS
jgi:hypothetical protein